MVRSSHLPTRLDEDTDGPPARGVATHAGKRRDTEQAVVSVLREAGRRLTPGEVVAALQARGILTRGAWAVRGALGALAKRGVIDRHGKGRHTLYAAH